MTIMDDRDKERVRERRKGNVANKRQLEEFL
jgi:hypothetical protein